ncbi:hypothetical protein KFE25_006720 [Diacronema lutheri]|uniref:TraB family protein n=1 Tax=Diacronema lutheri TaxID=2081491 RepID=A0A8J5XMF1_DIALT|nr:hypothetical protein KFE25_006720 [Diacronema lutheri]
MKRSDAGEEAHGAPLATAIPELVIVRADGVEVHLIGTCHLSSDAALYTGARVRELRPTTVVVELCEERRQMLTRTPRTPGDEPASTASSVGSSVGGVLTDWTQLISLMYHSFETLIDRQTGAEFVAAVQAAEECGARVVLGDRLASQTLGRLKRLITLRELAIDMQLLHADHTAQQAIDRAKLLEAVIAEAASASALARAIVRGGDAAAPATAPSEPPPPHASALEARLRAIEALAAQAQRASVGDAADGVMWRLLAKFWRRQLIDGEDRDLLRWAIDSTSLLEPLTDCHPPTFNRVLVAERDAILAAELARARGPRVVGVVGAAHMAGIARAFSEGGLPADAELASYREIPSWQPRPWHGIAGIVSGAVLGGAVRSVAFRRGLGLGALGVGAGSAWLVSELRERVRFFERSQREAAAGAEAQGAGAHC